MVVWSKVPFEKREIFSIEVEFLASVKQLKNHFKSYKPNQVKIFASVKIGVLKVEDIDQGCDQVGNCG